MKLKLMIPLLAFALGACSAKVDAPAAGPALVPEIGSTNSPDTQALLVKPDDKAGLNSITLNNHPGGDKDWHFTYSPKDTGTLQVTTGSITTLNCANQDFQDFMSIETVQDTGYTDLRYFAFPDRTQTVTAGKNYRLTFSLKKLGACSVAIQFSAEFTKTVNPNVPNNYLGKVPLNLNGTTITPGKQIGGFTVDLTYTPSQSQAFYNSSKFVTGDFGCNSTRKETWEFQELDANDKVISSRSMIEYETLSLVKDHKYDLRMMVSGTDACPDISYTFTYQTF